MLVSKIGVISLLLAALLLLATSITIDNAPTSSNYYSHSEAQQNPTRLLQATALTPTPITTYTTKIINDSNATRKAKGKAALSLNSGLQQIIKQWATSIRGRMGLGQYLQLYGIHTSQAYTFPSIPADYLVQVVEKASPALTNPAFTDIGIYSKLIDGQNYEIIVVLEGGDDTL
jgi:hypothetical protein